MNIRFSSALRHPRKLWRYVATQAADLRVIGIESTLRVLFLTGSCFGDRKFWNYESRQIQNARSAADNDDRLGGWMDMESGSAIYAVIRFKKPEIVVETGVGPGGTSAIILKALEHNGKGHLYSIDLPGNDEKVYTQLGLSYQVHIPEGFDVGWLVPPWLRNRWTLILGDAKEQLPKLLSTLPKVDVFIHDSLHTEEHVRFELGQALPRLSRNGVLMADDVNENWTLAFAHFCQEHGLPYRIHRNRLGIASVG